jgi:predicted AAA+ superfamily ATPase
MLKRKAYAKLDAWKRYKTKQALLITGARQVGKTYLAEAFAKRNYENIVRR